MRSCRLILPLLTCAGISFVSSAQTPTDTLRLSREECVAIALQESPTIKVANLEVKRMDYSKKEVLANLFPSIDFTGAYQRSIELQTVSMNMGGQSQQFKMGTDNVWNFGFSAAMPLVNASLWKSISISDTQILQTLESARASRLDMVNNINQAYYALMLAIDSREVIKANYDLAKFNADIYKKQFEAGTASEYDVLRSSVQVTNVEPELLQADIAVKQCQLQLKVLMGIDAEVAVMPTIDLSDMKREMYGYGMDTFSFGDVQYQLERYEQRQRAQEPVIQSIFDGRTCTAGADLLRRKQTPETASGRSTGKRTRPTAGKSCELAQHAGGSRS